MGDGELSVLISKMAAQNPRVTDQEIAAKVRVNVTRSPMEREALEPYLADLDKIRISPILESRVCVDYCPEYEYWYDTWQESIHYVIAGDSMSSAQDQLVRWMIKFRASLPGLLKTPSAANPRKPE